MKPLEFKPKETLQKVNMQMEKWHKLGMPVYGKNNKKGSKVKKKKSQIQYVPSM